MSGDDKSRECEQRPKKSRLRAVFDAVIEARMECDRRSREECGGSFILTWIRALHGDPLATIRLRTGDWR